LTEKFFKSIKSGGGGVRSGFREGEMSLTREISRWRAHKGDSKKRRKNGLKLGEAFSGNKKKHLIGGS